ncbi:MAG: hypothetical protein MI919_32720 [Holophagales bacterium]|nr:hypothetical protein [Holophagales bacterium]
MTVRDYLGETLRAVPASFRETQVPLVLGLGAMAVFLLMLVLISLLTGRHTLFFFIDIPESRRFGGGLATAISSFALVAAGTGLYVRSRMSLADPADSRGLTFAALGTVWLAMDELLMIHEWLTSRMDRVGIPKLFGVLDQDLLIFLGYAGLAILVGLRLLPLLHRHRQVGAPLVLAGAFYFGTQVVDVIPWDRLTALQQSVLGPLEEILKTLGSASLAIWSLLIVEEALRDHPPHAGGAS